MRLGGGGQVFALGAAALLKWQTFREKAFQKYTLQTRRQDLYSKLIVAKRHDAFCDRHYYSTAAISRVAIRTQKKWDVIMSPRIRYVKHDLQESSDCQQTILGP